MKASGDHAEPASSIPRLIDQTPSDALGVGVRHSSHRDGTERTDAVLEGTPAGFRLLAGILLEMAETVETMPGASETGYGLVLSPIDLRPLRAVGVDTVVLDCSPGPSRSTEEK